MREGGRICGTLRYYNYMSLQETYPALLSYDKNTELPATYKYTSMLVFTTCNNIIIQ